MRNRVGGCSKASDLPVATIGRVRPVEYLIHDVLLKRERRYSSFLLPLAEAPLEVVADTVCPWQPPRSYRLFDAAPSAPKRRGPRELSCRRASARH